jgi:hypothetical protein
VAYDQASALAVFASNIAEASGALDVAVVAPSIFNAVSFENVRAADNLNNNIVFYANISEGVQITAIPIGRYLWELIDDDQVPTWGTINNNQSVTWSAINDGQNPAWAEVQTNATTWVTIDNTQGSVWVDINIQP